MDDIAMDSGAVISPCGKYRYKLWRVWNDALPRAVFIMLNPSKADAKENDPTITRQIKRAMHFLPAQGFPCGGIEVVNLFAWRETYSSQIPGLHHAGTDLIGPENDAHILDATKSAAIIICAWGQMGVLGERSGIVLAKLRQAGRQLHVLKMGSYNQPVHPLYIGYDIKPVMFK